MWSEAGIEGGPHFRALLYNEPAQTLIAHFERHYGHWAGEIYTRPLTSEIYSKVPAASKLVSYSCPVSAASAPVIFFNEMVHRAEDPNGADWGCIRAVDLRTGVLSQVASADTVQVPDGYVGLWVSEIYAVDADATRLFCAIGFEQQVSAVEKHLDYWLCELPVRELMPRKLSKLQNTFF
jgi:hypothetical protein